MMRFIVKQLMFLPFAMACATLSQENQTTDLKLESTAELRKAVAAKTQGFVSAYQYDSKEYKVSWFVCADDNLKDEASTVFVMHDEMQSFDETKVCEDWRVQNFLNRGFRVVIANRPGFGSSTGKKDFIGPQSIDALEMVVNDFVKEFKDKKIDGIWGYSVGGSAAALISRKINSLSWVLIGGGFFDFDSVKSSTKDATFKEVLESLNKHSENSLTMRSIAYNVEGLPKNVFLYHGANDITSAVEEVKMFEETLTAMEIKVTLQLVENQTHDMSIDVHSLVLQSMIDKILDKKE